MKKYLQLKESNNYKENFIKVEVYYDKGGYNYVTYRQKPRGYYISVVPVTRQGYMESFTAFTGYNDLLLEVNRASEKQYNKAVELSAEKENIIIEKLKMERGYELAE